MQRFAVSGQQAIHEIAERHGFSPDAVLVMLNAVRAGHGGMAQFDHPEFGGCGQWMRGGMTMIGDMFNAGLKARVIALCEALAPLAAERPEPAAEAANPPGRGEPGAWWPPELGSPDSSGTQNGVRYAYFAAPRRLAVDQGGRVTLYDTGEHRIGGVAQQQSGRATLAFTSQRGPVDLASLRVVSGGGSGVSEHADPAQSSGSGDAFGAIEKLAELHAKGVLSADEFSAKKADLLRRL